MTTAPDPPRSSAIRAVLVVALVLAIAACDESIRSPTKYPDSVRVVVTGLPSDVEPEFTLATPTGLRLSLSPGERITDAAPGEYSITTHPIAYGNTTFTSASTSITHTLEPGKSITFDARYAPDRDVMHAAISRLNEYRVAAGVAPVTGAFEESLPQWLHTRYAVYNGTTGHYEDPNLPWYTPEGHNAAVRSNLAYGSLFRDENHRDPSDGTMWVDVWAQAPYHMFSLLDPRVTSVRFARFHAPPGEAATFPSAAAIQPIRTTDWGNAIVKFPAANATASIAVFRGENPSPLNNCPSYAAPAGLPIFFMAGRDSVPRISSTTLTRNGTPVEHCAYDGFTDQNRDRYPHLNSYGAAVLIPREPLVPGSTYEVRFVTDRGVIEWSFQTADVLIQRVAVAGVE